MKAKAEIQQRRKQVFELSQKGMTIVNIANSLNVTSRTIDKDLKALRTEIAKTYQSTTGWFKVADLTEGQRLRISRLWMIIADKTSTKNQVLNAIKLLQNEEDKTIRRDQMVGILPKDQEQGLPQLEVQEGGQANIMVTNVYKTIMEIKKKEEEISQESGG